MDEAHGSRVTHIWRGSSRVADGHRARTAEADAASCIVATRV